MPKRMRRRYPMVVIESQELPGTSVESEPQVSTWRAAMALLYSTRRTATTAITIEKITPPCPMTSAPFVKTKLWVDVTIIEIREIRNRETARRLRNNRASEPARADQTASAQNATSQDGKA